MTLTAARCACCLPGRPWQSGTMAVAYIGPAHRYRPLLRAIIKALHESRLMAPP